MNQVTFAFGSSWDFIIVLLVWYRLHNCDRLVACIAKDISVCICIRIASLDLSVMRKHLTGIVLQKKSKEIKRCMVRIYLWNLIRIQMGTLLLIMLCFSLEVLGTINQPKLDPLHLIVFIVGSVSDYKPAQTRPACVNSHYSLINQPFVLFYFIISFSEYKQAQWAQPINQSYWSHLFFNPDRLIVGCK